MRKINFFKYLPIALMMAFLAMTICFSCSKDDDENTFNNKEKYGAPVDTTTFDSIPPKPYIPEPRKRDTIPY